MTARRGLVGCALLVVVQPAMAQEGEPEDTKEAPPRYLVANVSLGAGYGHVQSDQIARFRTADTTESVTFRQRRDGLVRLVDIVLGSGRRSHFMGGFFTLRQFDADPTFSSVARERGLQAGSVVTSGCSGFAAGWGVYGKVLHVGGAWGACVTVSPSATVGDAEADSRTEVLVTPFYVAPWLGARASVFDHWYVGGRIRGDLEVGLGGLSASATLLIDVTYLGG